MNDILNYTVTILPSTSLVLRDVRKSIVFSSSNKRLVANVIIPRGMTKKKKEQIRPRKESNII